MIVKKINIVEDQFKAMFDDLPSYKYNETDQDEFKPNFLWGDKFELKAFLSNENKNDPYPLIWLTTPYIEDVSDKNIEIKNISIVLAVNTSSSIDNNVRLNTTFKKILIPMFEDIRFIFEKSNIVSKTENFRMIKFPNYSDSEDQDKDNNQTVEIWDALKLTFDIKLLNICYKPLKYFKNE